MGIRKKEINVTMISNKIKMEYTKSQLAIFEIRNDSYKLNLESNFATNHKTYLCFFLYKPILLSRKNNYKIRKKCYKSVPTIFYYEFKFYMYL